MKHTLTGILATVLVIFLCLPVPTIGAEITETTQVVQKEIKNATKNKNGSLVFEGLYYEMMTEETDKPYVYVTGIKKVKESYTIPEAVYYDNVAYEVLEIGENAFANAEMKSIELPDCIQSISPLAFISCSNLESIKIPEQCKYIGAGAFMNCDKLTNVDFGKSKCTEIGDAAFAMSGVESIELSSFVETLGDAVFSNCGKLEKFIFSKNCKKIGEGVFTDCSSLTNIKVPKKNEYIVVKDNCIYSKDYKTLYSASIAAGDLKIRKNTENILPYAFENNKKITSVIIPGNVKIVSECSFLGCTQLKSVVLEEGVEELAENCFYNCGKLTQITIPASLHMIFGNPFISCKKLTKFTVSSENPLFKAKNKMLVSKPDNYILSAPGVSGEVTLYSSCNGIAPYAFALNTKIEKIKLNKKLMSVEEGAFLGCKKLCFVYIPTIKIDFSTSELDGEGDFVGIFGGCSDKLEISIPHSTSESASIFESNLKRHCSMRVMITQR